MNGLSSFILIILNFYLIFDKIKFMIILPIMINKKLKENKMKFDEKKYKNLQKRKNLLRGAVSYTSCQVERAIVQNGKVEMAKLVNEIIKNYFKIIFKKWDVAYKEKEKAFAEEVSNR